jgi:hypothetical protein
MSEPTLDQAISAALHAAKFGSLARLLILEDAKASHAAAPGFYADLVSNLLSFSDRDIEQVAVPLVREHVEIATARAALEFFSSAVGAGAADKLTKLGVPELTPTVAAALAEFSASDNGAKFLAAMGNPLLIAAIVQSIGQHAP